MDKSVDEILSSAVKTGATGTNADWSLFAHKIKRTQNRQLQRNENIFTKWLFQHLCDQQIVHKHLRLTV